jgi:hypothetical protein
MRRITSGHAALALAALAAAGVAAAAKGPRTVDNIWVHPRYPSFDVRSIAMLPPASFERDFDAERQVQGQSGRALVGSGYRWVSSLTTREIVRASASGDSLLKAVNARVLADGRVDSLTAGLLCRMVRTDAVMSVRVDQWTQVAIEPGQSGKPWTTVQLHAALVDSTGSLLWSASGSETVEGLQYDPAQADAEHSGSAGTRESGLHGSTAAGAPPPYSDVLDRLLTRWAKQFPARPASADSAAAK